MTRYALQRPDGYFFCRWGFTTKEYHATTFESMTEAEIAILENNLSECKAVPVDVD